MYRLLQLVEKLHHNTRDIYESNLKGSRSQTIAKGYQATYDDFFRQQKNSVYAADIQGQI